MRPRTRPPGCPRCAPVRQVVGSRTRRKSETPEIQARCEQIESNGVPLAHRSHLARWEGLDNLFAAYGLGPVSNENKLGVRGESINKTVRPTRLQPAIHLQLPIRNKQARKENRPRCSKLLELLAPARSEAKSKKRNKWGNAPGQQPR